MATVFCRRRYDHHVAMRVSAATYERIRRAAAQREQRITELVRDAIRAHLHRIEMGNREAER
jgi:uncharacterized protein (DUF1778 family)